MPKLKSQRGSSIIRPIASGAASPDVTRIKLSLQLLHGQLVAMGPGKADLLDYIIKTGSISQAGKAMGMSYRRAWALVDEMNQCFKKPLVITKRGGSISGGATVSEYGLQVLAHYRKMAASAAEVALIYAGVFNGLMSEPREEQPLDNALESTKI